ncbi:HPr family phosphocarrier protein [Planctomycetales bacterium ZRK34]|nr:HPr family phosphocarrier protein [Planctomycetales bacterium ZRK34]
MPSADHTVKATVTIINRLGLHARPAMALVDAANRHEAAVTIRKDGCDESHDAKSIMSVMMLAAGKGTKLQLEATGPDADAVIEELKQLVASKFDED